MSTTLPISPIPNQKLPKGVICPLCLWILEKPRACHHCQQSFCESCLMPWLKHTPNCPKCEGYVTPKILLDTTATVENLLLEFAFSALPDPERRSRENLLAYIDILRKGKEEFQQALLPKEATQESTKDKTVTAKVGDYLKSLDELQREMTELLSAMNTTRKVTWKAEALETNERIDMVSRSPYGITPTHSTKHRTYALPLPVLIETLTQAVNGLRSTNSVLESEFSKSQQSYMRLSIETVAAKILGKKPLTNTRMLYPVYGQQQFSVKAAINKRSEILAHLNIMLVNLNQWIKKDPDFSIQFSTEEEMFYIFLKVFHVKLFESPLFRKICNEIWRTLLAYGKPTNASSIAQLLREHLDLYAQGICEISTHPLNYPLHKAVFENDLPLIRRLCVGESRKTFYALINEVDPLNNTPLMLSTILKRKDCVRVLCDHYADPYYKPFVTSLSAIDYAVSKNSRELLTILLGTAQRSKKNSFDLYKSNLLDSIENLPDLYLELHLNCNSSFIPFVGSFAPSDTYKVYKKGSAVRIDLTMLNLRGSEKGNHSILLKGRGTNRAGELLLVDHVGKTVEDFFREPSEESIENAVNEMLEGKNHANEVRSQEISLVPAQNKGKPVMRGIEGYVCKKYTAKYTMKVERLQKDSVWIEAEPKSFHDYFKKCLERLSQSSTKCKGGDYTASPSIIKGSSIKEESYKATLYASERYPLKYHQFLPLLHILGYASPHIGKFVEFLSQNHLENIGFPLKVSVPVFFTVVAHLTLKNLQFLSPDLEFMNADCTYIPLNIQEPTTTNNNEIALYSPIKAGSPMRNCSPKHAKLYDEESYPGDRLSWNSEQDSNNDESILRAEQQFQTLLRKSESDEEEFARLADLEEDKEVPVDELEEFEKGCNACENIETHCDPGIKTLNFIKNSRRSPRKLTLGDLTRKSRSCAKEPQQGTMSPSNTKMRVGEERIPASPLHSLIIKPIIMANPKKPEVEPVTKINMQGRELMAKFRSFLGQEAAALTKKTQDVDVHLKDGYDVLIK